MSHVQCARIVNAPKFEAFNFLTAPGTLSQQLNGLIDVTWQNPGVELKVGSEFLYTMSRFGIEQPIRFVVDRLVVGNSLTYRQVSGLYLRFIHSMRFEERSSSETLVTDILDYEIPFGLFGRIADDIFIRSDLKKILNHRLDQAEKHFSRNIEAKENQISGTH